MGPVMIVSVAAAAVVLLFVSVVVVRWWVWAPVVRKAAVVQLEGGVAFDGVVMARRGPLLTLADVTARLPDGEQRIDGVVVVERSKVMFMQVR